MTSPTYEPHTALIVVDVQNDFADPSGSLYVRGGEEVVDAVNQEIARAIAAGSPVLYTQDWHPPVTPHFEKDGGIWPVHCVRDTWGAELHPGLTIAGEVVRKGIGGEDGYSGFSVRHPVSGETAPTPLYDLLRSGGVERLVVVGLATDYCVAETVTDARMLGFPVRVPPTCIRAVDLQPGDGDRALTRMRDAGADVD
jgi:nicotinamidase/pyrazinamidase